MLSEFKEFIAKGNVMQLAVAVIIGGAFGTIVTSLTDEVIMPIVGAIFGGADFSGYFILLSAPDGYEGSLTDYAALKEAGAAMIVVHGRTIDMKNHRSLHPADHEAIGIIRTHVRVPVVANGDIRSMEEHGRCLEKTGADGAMVATELM